MSPLALLVAGAFFMEFLDGTVIATALPRMAASLGAPAVALQIGISAYLLTVAVFILPGGWMAHRFGTKRVFTGALAVFTLGSALCGLAWSVETFVAARVLQGIGGAMMVPVGRLAVLRTTEKAGLMRAIAVLTWPGLTAPLLGPPLGGFIAEHFTWRYIFLLNIPLGLAAIPLALRLVPSLAPEARRAFDGLGFAYGAACLASACVAFDMMGEQAVAWPTVAGLAAIATVSGGLLWRHLHRHPHPLVDPAPLAVPTYRLVMLDGTLMRTLISAMPFLLPLLFQLGFGFDPFQAGLLVLALFAGNIGIKPLTTPILRRWGFRNVMVANGMLQAVTMLACAVLQPSTPLPVIVGLLVLSGASRSLQFTAFGTLAFADVPASQMSPANTMFSVCFQLAFGLGVAVGAVILRSASTLLADPGTPSLTAFRATFVVLAALVAANALTATRLARDAGAVVSGHAPRLRPAGG